jgi:hypothetical protein
LMDSITQKECRGDCCVHYFSQNIVVLVNQKYDEFTVETFFLLVMSTVLFFFCA